MKQNDYDKRLMNAVKTLRKKSGKKQLELALAIGKEQPAYSKMENAKAKTSYAQLRTFAKVLNVHIGTFFDMADESEKIQWQ